jgi:hypothetical protein
LFLSHAAGFGGMPSRAAVLDYAAVIARLMAAVGGPVLRRLSRPPALPR